MAVERQFTASTYVFRRNNARLKLLLIYSAKFNMWMPPGGHLELNERPEQAALRELHEETGCEASLIRFEPELSLQDSDSVQLVSPVYVIENCIPGVSGSDDHYHVDFIFAASWLGGEVSLRNQEVGAIKWFSREELPRSCMFENSVLIAEDLFKRVFELLPESRTVTEARI